MIIKQGSQQRRAVVAVALALCFAGGAGAGATTAAAAGAQSGAASSELRVRAAVVPLAAVLICTRLCPVAGGAAARVLHRTSRQIRHIPAPRPQLAQQFSNAAGSEPGFRLGLALSRGNLNVARARRAAGFQAHHIVAHHHPRAEFARQVLQLRGIGPNSAANGVWLKAGQHSGIHSYAYFSNINHIVGKYYFNPFLTRADLIDDLARIGKHLQVRQFPL